MGAQSSLEEEEDEDELYEAVARGPLGRQRPDSYTQSQASPVQRNLSFSENMYGEVGETTKALPDGAGSSAQVVEDDYELPTVQHSPTSQLIGNRAPELPPRNKPVSQVCELPVVPLDPIAVAVSSFPSAYTDPESVSSAAAADGETYDVMDHSANSIVIPTEVTGEVYEAPVPVTQNLDSQFSDLPLSEMNPQSSRESETYEFPLVIGSGSVPPAGSETSDAVYEVPVVRVSGAGEKDTDV